MMFRSTRLSPLQALGAGLVAGAFGSLVQDLFFRATGKLAPSPPAGAFSPPEAAQRDEAATQTVARRVVEGLARRSLPSGRKPAAGMLVHYAFGSAWGGLYGLARARRRDHGPLAALAFSLAVWGASDNVILPAFRLAAPPTAYPPKAHAYAIAAHVAYGAAVATAFERLRAASTRHLATLGRALWAIRALPAFARGPARRGAFAAWRYAG